MATTPSSSRRLRGLARALRSGRIGAELGASGETGRIAAAPAAAAERKAQIALVGAGMWATGWHLPHLSEHPGADIAAIVEMDAEHRASLGEQYGCATFATLDELIARQFGLARFI